MESGRSASGAGSGEAKAEGKAGERTHAAAAAVASAPTTGRGTRSSRLSRREQRAGSSTPAHGGGRGRLPPHSRRSTDSGAPPSGAGTAVAGRRGPSPIRAPAPEGEAAAAAASAGGNSRGASTPQGSRSPARRRGRAASRLESPPDLAAGRGGRRQRREADEGAPGSPQWVRDNDLAHDTDIPAWLRDDSDSDGL